MQNTVPQKGKRSLIGLILVVTAVLVGIDTYLNADTPLITMSVTGGLVGTSSSIAVHFDGSADLDSNGTRRVIQMSPEAFEELQRVVDDVPWVALFNIEDVGARDAFTYRFAAFGTSITYAETKIPKALTPVRDQLSMLMR